MMILTSGANDITLTLNETKTLDNPDYVLVFRCVDTKKQVACILGEDTSEYPERRNDFVLTVKEDADHTASEVTLDTYRSYKYFVYEMEDASEFDFENINTIDLSSLDGEVERGLMDYITDPEELVSYRDRVQSIKNY